LIGGELLKVKVSDFDPYTTTLKGKPINGGVAFQWQTKNEKWKYTLYNNGVCRIDDFKKFTTKYYEGSKKQLKWWRKFEKQWHKDFEKMKDDKIKQWYKAKRQFLSIVDKLASPDHL
jgi:hypothetical protein